MPIDLSSQIIHAVRSVVGPGKVMLHEPRFNGNEYKYLKECLDSTFVSSVGKYVEQFERSLEDYTGAKFAVTVVNGTAALHVALSLAGVKAYDEVLLPSLTFVATANAVTYLNAIPHFIDCEEQTLGIDPEALRDYLKYNTEIVNGQCINRHTGNVIRAVVPMHTFGHPANIEAILAVSNDFYLTVVEDASESLGSYLHGRHTGTFGLIGTLSFNGNKTITTGGGGALLTNNREISLRAKHITTTAKIPHRWRYDHDEIGFNYRLPNLNAALGCAQLEQLEGYLQKKRSLFNSYKSSFQNITGLKLFEEPRGSRSNYWLQCILLDKNMGYQLDNILSATNDDGLMTRPLWTLMHKLPMYSKFPRAPLPVSESLSSRIINIPSSYFLS